MVRIISTQQRITVMVGKIIWSRSNNSSSNDSVTKGTRDIHDYNTLQYKEDREGWDDSK